MADGDVLTYYENGQWKSGVDGNSRASHVGGTKAEQSSVGRDMARDRGVEHRITRRDGAVTQQNSYGNDQKSSKG